MRISIVTFDGFSEIDAFVLLNIFNQMRSEGWRADIVCAGPKITSVGSVVVASQRPLEWANESDVVLFGSSTRMREVAADVKTMGRLQLDPSQQLIGAMCNGSLILHALDLLPNKQVCAEQPSMAWLVQAGLKPVAKPLIANGNIATAGGRLAATYLAAWAIWRLDGDESVRHALYRVAPAGEEEAFIAHAMGIVRPFIDGAAPEVAYEPEPVAQVPAEPIYVPAPVAEVQATPVVETVAPRPAATNAPISPSFQGFGHAVFSGIVRGVGKIATVQPMLNDVLRVMVACEHFNLSEVTVGSQLAVNGMVREVVAKTERSFKYDLSAVEVEQTVGLEEPGNEVNLERPLKPGMRVGGHLLMGQVDGVGEVLKFAEMGECWQLVVQIDKALGRCLAVKGFVAINGVSLASNQVKDTKDKCIFSVNLIPHTLSVTSLKHLQAGDKVNVEVDTVARYLHQQSGWLDRDNEPTGKARRATK